MDLPITVKVALLQALSEKPGFGLDLIARVSSSSGDAFILREGSVYPALRALQREDLIKVTSGEQRADDYGGRPRRYYAITPAGQKVLRAQRAAIARLFSLVDAKKESRRG